LKLTLSWLVLGVHLAPMACKYTWEWKGSKDIKIIGMEDKRRVTICVSFASDWSLLLMQIILVGKTNHCLPKTTDAKLYLDFGFHFTMSESHFSTQKKCQQFVWKFLVPYYNDVVEKMGSQKLIWPIDCWSVNKFEAFISWVKTEFPFSFVLFVPTNCALKLQLDVILHRPLKCEFTKLQKMVYIIYSTIIGVWSLI
jgi:hypothetical protein